MLETTFFIPSTTKKYEEKDVYCYEKNKEIKVYTTDKISVHCENLDKEIDADFFIFASKHRSEKETKSLSVHALGNWAIAELGGKDYQLCIAPALYLRKAILLLEKFNKIGYEVIQECTHHGPYLKKPVMFIEIGSTEHQWKDVEAAKVIAKAILALISEEVEEKPVIMGIGGLHTTPNFKKLLKDYALGHVCPKYMLKHLTPELIKQAMERSIPKIERIFVDWKGLKEYKEKVKSMLEALDLSYERTDKY